MLSRRFGLFGCGAAGATSGKACARIGRPRGKSTNEIGTPDPN